MFTLKNALMGSLLALLLGFGTACFSFFPDNKPAQEAEIAACAGLSGQAMIDCEARHAKP